MSRELPRATTPNTKTIANLSDLKAAIEEVVAYMWRDEEADFEEHEGDGNDHIFRTLQALDTWLYHE